jgi:DNA polymerase III sliding clamp (beta) subunit (PCNA family)
MEFYINDKKKAEYFSVIFQNTKDFSDHTVMYFDENGLFMQGMNNSHVCLYELNIPKEWFHEYNYTSSSEKLLLGINNETIYKIINTKQEKHTIYFKYKQDDDHMDIIFKKNTNDKETNDKETNGKKQKETKTLILDKFYQIKLIDLEENLLEIPETEYNVDILIPTKSFADIIQELTIFHTDLKIVCTEEKINLIANGNNANMTANIDIDDLSEYAIEEDYEYKQHYSLEFVKLMTQFSKLSNEIFIGLSDSTPMKVEYKFQEGVISLYLAPKIEDDDLDD